MRVLIFIAIIILFSLLSGNKNTKSKNRRTGTNTENTKRQPVRAEQRQRSVSTERRRPAKKKETVDEMLSRIKEHSANTDAAEPKKTGQSKQTAPNSNEPELSTQDGTILSAAKHNAWMKAKENEAEAKRNYQKELEDLMIMGPTVNLEYRRDFVAEAQTILQECYKIPQ